MQKLSDIEIERYKRQILIWGEDNQMKLKNTKVMVIGAGGLGSPILYYLAAAGIGEIRICDFDEVNVSNLNRQILHTTRRINVNKAESAKMTLSEFNDQIRLVPIKEKITAQNIGQSFKGCDFLIDACDNVRSKEELNRMIIENEIPSVMTSFVGCGGFVFFNTPQTVCWQCLFKKVTESGKKKKITPFKEFPSSGASCGLLGSVTANLVIRYLLGYGEAFLNKIFYLPQLWNFSNLMLVDKTFSFWMTDHFKSMVKTQQRRFPGAQDHNFIEQNDVLPDSHCPVCQAHEPTMRCAV